MTKKKKYLFVYLHTGGGHLAPAKAVAQYIERTYGNDAEPVLIDLFEKTSRLIHFAIVDGYRILMNKAKWLYALIYAFYKIKLVSKVSAGIVANATTDYFAEIISREKPDKIIVLHFFCIEPVYRVLEREKLNIPVITVVTDPFTAHPLWFLREQQNFIVFSERLREHYIRNGIAPERLKVMPFILNERFNTRPTEETILQYKQKHSFTPGKKVVLVLGGGDGIPRGKQILEQLLSLPPDFEIAFVCGKNKTLLRQAQEKIEGSANPHLKVYGYVDFVYELISLSDIVITKCGASTFMEILMLKKIPLVNSYIWEQEKGNVDFIVENGLGLYESRVSRLPVILNRLLHNEVYYTAYHNANENTLLENGTSAAGDYIHTFPLQ